MCNNSFCHCRKSVCLVKTAAVLNSNDLSGPHHHNHHHSQVWRMFNLLIISHFSGSQDSKPTHPPQQISLSTAGLIRWLYDYCVQRCWTSLFLSHVSNKRMYGIFGQGSKSEVNTVIRKARNNHQTIFETFDILAAAPRPPHKISPHWEGEDRRRLFEMQMWYWEFAWFLYLYAKFYFQILQILFKVVHLCTRSQTRNCANILNTF